MAGPSCPPPSPHGSLIGQQFCEAYCWRLSGALLPPPQVKVDGKVVLSLLGMPRPFTALKALDMEEEGKKVWHARQLG